VSRAPIVAGAAGCLAAAALFFLLAADVARWPDALEADDVRYRVAPADDGLWKPAELVPRGVASAVLGVDDDVAFRRAVRAFRLGRLDAPFVTDPRRTLHRADAQDRLSVIAAGDGDPERRSAAANLLGVLSLVGAFSEYAEREALHRNAVASFERAIALDPANADAKHNLELALQQGRGLGLAESLGGRNPSPGGRGARGAGAGVPGTGY